MELEAGFEPAITDFADQPVGIEPTPSRFLHSHVQHNIHLCVILNIVIIQNLTVWYTTTMLERLNRYDQNDDKTKKPMLMMVGFSLFDLRPRSWLVDSVLYKNTSYHDVV